jgi:hypothetical protein
MGFMPASLPSSSLGHRLLLAAWGAGLAIVATGCGAPPDGQNPEAVGSSVQAITGSTILSRADEWVTAKLLYCQSPNGAPDPDPSCSPTCTRESNPAWDPYRSDCSGFVSWAWNLPAPGHTTSEFAPADTSVSFVIDGSELQPGDAVNIPADHMVLFVSWVTPGSKANFYEEPGCSASEPYAHAFTSTLSISGSSVTIDYEGKTFTAIRYIGLTGVGDAGADSGTTIPCTVTTTGDMGDCLDTSVCASMGGTSTPGYCPGPTDIQCCTGVPATSSDSGSSSGPEAGTASPDSGKGTGPTHDGGTTGPVSDDGSPTSGDGGSQGEAPRAGTASGCSAAPSRGDGEGARLFVLGALGFTVARRRRRHVA